MRDETLSPPGNSARDRPRGAGQAGTRPGCRCRRGRAWINAPAASRRGGCGADHGIRPRPGRRAQPAPPDHLSHGRSWRAEGRGGGAASFRSQPRQALGCGAVLVKGGDAPARRPCKDRLFAQPGALPLPFRGPRFAQSIRGTGCRLASDIAAGRVRGDDQPAAVARSRALLMAEFAELADGGKRAGIPFGPRFPSLKMPPQPRHGPGHGHTTSAGKLPSTCPRRQPARSARPVDFDTASLAHCPRLARHIRPAPQSADANPQAHSSS